MLEMEAKIQEFERRKIDEEALKHAEQERTTEQVATANAVRESAEKELLILKSRITNYESLQCQMEREQTENSELKSKINKLESELNGYLGNEHDMTDQVIKLRNHNELLRDELKLTQDQMGKVQDNHDRIVMTQRAALVDDKNQLQMRATELDEKCQSAHSKLQKAAVIHKKYKRKYHRYTDYLRDKIQLLEAKNTEIDLEKQALSKCVPQEVYRNLKKQWKILYQRHQEFRAFLLPGISHINIGDKSFATIQMPFDASMPNWGALNLDKEHENDLRLLQKRVEVLGDSQRMQLEELTNITNNSLRISHFDDRAPLTKADLDGGRTSRDSLFVDEKIDIEKDLSS